MAVSGLGTVFVYVGQLERSIDFYKKVGLKARGIEDWGIGKRGATLFFNEINSANADFMGNRGCPYAQQAIAQF